MLNLQSQSGLEAKRLTQSWFWPRNYDLDLSLGFKHCDLILLTP